MMFEPVDSIKKRAVLKLIGVGGGGCNMVRYMLDKHVAGVQLQCVNTDVQALSTVPESISVPIGQGTTKGLGAGANPATGLKAAQEDGERLKNLIRDTDMLFITAGMGGGTGTGASPEIARIARELGVLTVAVLTKPFEFENRMSVAEEGLLEMRDQVDALIVIPNEKLCAKDENITIQDAFARANEVIYGAVQGIADVITKPGLINVDFADVRTVMQQAGMAMMGTGFAEGKTRAQEACHMAIASPLLENTGIDQASGVLINVVASSGMTMSEYREVGEIVKQHLSDNATVVAGAVQDDEMGDEMRVTIIATGLHYPGQKRENPQQPRPQPQLRDINSADIKQQARAHSDMHRPQPGAPGSHDKVNFDMLDVPAFLRRQVD